MLLKLHALCSCWINRIIMIRVTAPRHCGKVIVLVATRIIPLVYDGIDFMQKNAIHMNTEPQDPFRAKQTRKGFVYFWFMCDYTAECCTVAIRGPEPPTGARGLLQTAKSYERVSTFSNRKCDRGVHPATDAKQKKKCFGDWNVMWTVGFNHWTPQGWYRLPSMLLKAKGSFRPGSAAIRSHGVSNHNLQRPQGAS